MRCQHLVILPDQVEACFAFIIIDVVCDVLARQLHNLSNFLHPEERFSTPVAVVSWVRGQSSPTSIDYYY